MGGWDFPVPTARDSTIAAGRIEAAFTHRGVTAFWHFYESGAFMYAGSFLEDIPQVDPAGESLSIERTIANTAVALLFAPRLYRDLGAEAAVAYEIGFHGIGDRRFVSLSHRFHMLDFVGLRNTIEPEFVGRGEASVLDLESGSEQLATDYLVRLFSLFQYENPRPAIERELGRLRRNEPG